MQATYKMAELKKVAWLGCKERLGQAAPTFPGSRWPFEIVELSGSFSIQQMSVVSTNFTGGAKVFVPIWFCWEKILERCLAQFCCWTWWIRVCWLSLSGHMTPATGVGGLVVLIFTQAGGVDNQDIGIPETNDFEDSYASTTGAGTGHMDQPLPGDDGDDKYFFEAYWGAGDQDKSGIDYLTDPGPDSQGPVTVGIPGARFQVRAVSRCWRQGKRAAKSI